MKQIIGKKLGMTQIFTESGEIVPVTVIEAGPCVITQVKTSKKDGYDAVQVGFKDVDEKKLNRPLAGHFKKNGVAAKSILSELRGLDARGYTVGDRITVEDFAEVKYADVTGISIGKGFAGVIKRWNFSGGPASHGSHSHRIPGSIGSSATPSRVRKGMKMPGHLGHSRVTVKNLEIVKIDAAQNTILIKGAVPGPDGNVIRIAESRKSANKG